MLKRPADLCRSWLFVNGAEAEKLDAAPDSGADVLIQELEDFTPPRLRPAARDLAVDLYDAWRARGAIAAVRVNPLDGDGRDDLAAVMRGRPDIVALPKVAGPEQVVDLDEAVTLHERDLGIEEGTTALVPNIESAAGLVRTGQIARASRRVVACLVASEDMAADLGAERAPDSAELDYVRQRFLVECVAAGTVAIDCPYTWSDAAGAEADARRARRLGYTAKSAVAADHAAIVNAVFTPAPDAVTQAKRVIAAFEDAQAQGLGRIESDGSLIEVPTYTNARRLVARAEALEKAR